jgi:hypothetical protein
MSSYFSYVPEFYYVDRSKESQSLSDFSLTKNFFKRFLLRDDIAGNLSFFEKYTIIGDDRPDNVADEIYGDSSLDWLVLIANNILNVYDEWPMPQSAFEKYLLEKYLDYDNLYNTIHHYETSEVRDSKGIVLLKAGSRISNTWRTNGNFVEAINSKIKNIESGDGIVSSTTVRVELRNGIIGLDVGQEIIIENISHDPYNGRFVITNITNRVNGITYEFEYELSSPPEIASPELSFIENPETGTISGTQVEEARYILTNSAFPGNSYYFEYFDSEKRQLISLPSTDFLVPVTNYDYEFEKENKKRNIYLLKPDYLNIIFNDMEELMKYKEGGVQYVNETTKQGENIKLYG